MDDFPQRIPDLLESATDRVRSLTVDRVARFLKFLALGMVMTVLVAMAVIFLLVGLARIVDGLILKACGDCGWSTEVAYAAVGSLFLLGGGVLWALRLKAKGSEEPEE